MLKPDYSWLVPPPQSKSVTAIGSISSPGSASTVTVVTYTVPEGIIFALRGVTIGVVDPSSLWSEGSQQLVFTLFVTAAGGTRPVDYFANLVNQVGSHAQPYPVLGRTDFEENNILNWVAVSDGTVTDANLFGHIMGFERPSSGCR